MKLFTKLMILVVLAALVAPFVLRGPDGQPIMELNDVLPDAMGVERSLEGALDRAENAAGELLGEDAPTGTAGMTRVVRWQDANGVWHFAQEAPEGVVAEEMLIDPDANLVQGMAPQTPAPANASTQSSLPSSPSGYVEQASALQSEAEAIRSASEARVEELEALRRKATP